MLAYRGFRIALRHPDPFASLLAFGTTLLLVLEAAINVAVVLGCLPTKGLALPFVSYGGSAILAALAETASSSRSPAKRDETASAARPRDRDRRGRDRRPPLPGACPRRGAGRARRRRDVPRDGGGHRDAGGAAGGIPAAPRARAAAPRRGAGAGA